MKRLVLTILLLIYCFITTRATDYYVDATTGSNTTGNGSSGTPWQTITYALNQIAGTGHTLYVAAGTYDPTLGETFPILMKNGVSLVGAGIDISIIDANSTDRVIDCISIVDPSTKVEGFTIKGGGSDEGFFISAGSALKIVNNKIANNGKGLYLGNSPATIMDNTISGNSGSGIYISNSSPFIKGNRITGNTGGNGLYISGSSSLPRIVNNLITKNSEDGISCRSSSIPGIINNTFSENSDSIFIRMKLDNIPSTLTFNQDHVSTYTWEYDWSIYFDSDGNISTGNSSGFDVEICICHYKDGAPFMASIIDGTDHITIEWSGSSGYHRHDINARIDTTDPNVIIMSVSKTWAEIANIEETDRYFFDAHYCALEGHQRDETYVATGKNVVVTDSQGDVSYDFIDIIEGIWNDQELIDITHPTNLTATPGNQQITLSWSPNTDPDLDQYNIYRDLSSPAITLIDSVISSSPPDTFYIDTDLIVGQDYYYRIKAKDTAGNESDFSDEVMGTPITGLQQDSLALVALYNSTDGANWTNNINWLTSNVSTWYGITVSDDRVTEILLDSNNLIGTIPPEIGNLTNLQILKLDYNQLSGSIPLEIGNLTNLTELTLWSNQLTDIIPSEIGNLTSLTILDLDVNQLSGDIPSEIGNLVNLEELWSCKNQLTGSIPSSIGNLTNLTVFSIWENQLTGIIPTEIGNLVNLTNLSLSSNLLTGAIPSEIGNLSELDYLSLTNNQLTNSIPIEIGNLDSLRILALGGNQLSGSIPTELQNLNNLTKLYLWGNELTGSIPPEIGNLVNLTNLQLSSNLLTGIIPPEIGNLIKLEVLYLWGNQITGAIPTEIGNLSNLTNLSLLDNQLSGSIPPEICNLTSLQILYLNDNQFTDLPDLSSLVLLDDLRIQNNQFTFKDIEPNIGVPSTTFTYSPQDSVGIEKTAKVALDSSYTMSVDVGGDNNVYQWYLDGNAISGATDTSYTVSAVTEADYGKYICEITNTLATGLTLYSRPVSLLPDRIIVTDGSPYFQDFESGEGGWVAAGTNSSWEYGTPSGNTINNTASGSNVWMTSLSGDYNPDEVSWVVSPIFDLSGLSNPAVDFKAWWDCEGTYDGACLQYSEDTAKTWHTLRKPTDYMWYNRSDVVSLLYATGFGNGWSGDGTFGEGSNGWTTLRSDISYPDEYGSLRFRVLFTSNGSYEKDGFAFDDVMIYNDPSSGLYPDRIDKNQFTVYPNPGTGMFTLTGQLERPEDLTIGVLNLQGQVIFTKEFPGRKSFNEQIDLTFCTEGIYILRIKAGDYLGYQKIIIQ